MLAVRIANVKRKVQTCWVAWFGIVNNLYFPTLLQYTRFADYVQFHYCVSILLLHCSLLILQALVVKLVEGTGVNANNGIFCGVLVTVGNLARVVGDFANSSSIMFWGVIICLMCSNVRYMKTSCVHKIFIITLMKYSGHPSSCN